MNRKWFLTSVFALLTATGIFWGCQKEEVINPDNDLFLKSTLIYTEGDCDTKCLDLEATELTAYEKTYSKDYTTTPPENVTVKIYNNATQIVYTITSTTRIKYLQIGNVVYHNTPQNDNSTANNPLILGPIGISLPTPWSSCEPLENTIIVRRNQQNPTGNPEKELVFNTSYSLIGICTSTTVEADFEEPVCIDETEVTITGTVESGGSFTGGFIRLQELINNDWVDINGAEADVTATNKVVVWSYIPDMAGSREFRAVYDGSGSNGYNNSESVPVVVQAENCNVCDDANFSYQTEDNLDIVFSYNHDEEAELSIEFTFPQVLNLPLNQDGKYVAPDGKIYMVNNPTNQTVFKWTGMVGCTLDEPTRFAFVHVPDCSAQPANDGKANIWTDAKIVAIDGTPLVDDPNTPENEGPVSLKGTLSNIVYFGCPVN